MTLHELLGSVPSFTMTDVMTPWPVLHLANDNVGQLNKTITGHGVLCMCSDSNGLLTSCY